MHKLHYHLNVLCIRSYMNSYLELLSQLTVEVLRNIVATQALLICLTCTPLALRLQMYISGRPFKPVLHVLNIHKCNVVGGHNCVMYSSHEVTPGLFCK